MNLVLMKKKNKFQFVEQITIAAAHLGGGLFVYCDQPSSHRVRRIGGFFHATRQFAPSVRRFNLTAPPVEIKSSIMIVKGQTGWQDTPSGVPPLASCKGTFLSL